MTDELLEQKIRVARAYESTMVRHEVEEFLSERGAEGFRVETLLYSIPRTPGEMEMEPKPEWEVHGERLVREGVYDRVIRLREHLVPLVRALEVPYREASGSR